MTSETVSKRSKINLLIDEHNVVDLSKFAEARGAILLDEDSIGTQIEQLSETDPYFYPPKVDYVQKVTRLIAGRMARVFSPSWGSPSEVIAEAIYFPLWCDVCTILALRRVARVIAVRARNKAVLVVVPKLDLECLSPWQHNELETLMLCWALQQQGCEVYLLTKGHVTGGYPEITLRASPLALPPSGVDIKDREGVKGGPIVAPEGMRGLDILWDEIRNASVLAGSVVFHRLPPLPTYYLIGSEFPATKVCVRFTPTRLNHFCPLRHYSAEWPRDPLTFYFNGILGPHFPSMVERAHSLVSEAEITEAYVCDHLFLGSSILAHAIKERGGSVVLWPHSANPSHINVRQGKHFDRITVLTRAARSNWKSKFPDKSVTIRPQIMFPLQRKPNDFDRSAPLTVVVFGGGYFLARFPLLRIERHLRTYRRFFSLGQSAAQCVRLKFKGKDGYRNETAAWFRGNVAQDVEFETRMVTQLNYPNMIFVTIGCGSTALLEGIACAVPCMIVREQDFDEYVDINGEVVPVGDVDFIWKLIMRCQNPDYYEKLLRAQINWLSHETFADSTGEEPVPKM